MFIGSRVHDSAQLCQHIRNAVVARRVPLHTEQVAKGRTEVFRALPDGVAMSESVSASRELDYPMRVLQLTSQALQIEAKQLPR